MIETKPAKVLIYATIIVKQKKERVITPKLMTPFVFISSNACLVEML